MTTAFQIGAFQFTGFQEERVTGSGGLPPWLVKLLMQRRQKRKTMPRPEPVTQEELVGAIAEIRSRLGFRLRPVAVPRASLEPLAAAVRTHLRIADEAEFRKQVEEFDALLDDWLDAA